MYPTVVHELYFLQVDGIYDNPLELLDIKPEFSDDEGLNNSKGESKVKGKRKTKEKERKSVKTKRATFSGERRL